MTGMTQPASPLSVSSLAQLTLSLIAIVALIFVLSWLLKRFKLASPRSRGDLVVLDEVSVGPRERVLLIRVGDAQVLVGVGAAGIVGLTPLATPIALHAPSTAAPAFADRLREFVKGGRDS